MKRIFIRLREKKICCSCGWSLRHSIIFLFNLVSSNWKHLEKKRKFIQDPSSRKSKKREGKWKFGFKKKKVFFTYSWDYIFFYGQEEENWISTRKCYNIHNMCRIMKFTRCDFEMGKNFRAQHLNCASSCYIAFHFW